VKRGAGALVGLLALALIAFALLGGEEEPTPGDSIAGGPAALDLAQQPDRPSASPQRSTPGADEAPLEREPLAGLPPDLREFAERQLAGEEPALGSEDDPEPSRSLSGVVLLPNGQLGAGAEVALGELERVVCTADEGGRFSIAGLDHGPHALWARAGRYLTFEPLWVQAGALDQDGLQLHLELGLVLEVRAADGHGAALPGAEVVAFPPGSDDLPPAFAEARALRFTTGTDGIGRLEGLTPGRWSLRISHSTGEGQLEVGLMRGSPPIHAELVVGPRSGLTGRLLAADGAPLADCMLGLRRSGGRLNLFEHTDAEGRFAVPDLPSGRYTLLLLEGLPEDAAVLRLLEIDLAAGEQRELELWLPHDANLGRLRGRLEREGRPVPGVVVAAVHQRGEASFRGATNAEGEFDFDGLAPGRWVLQGGGTEVPVDVFPGGTLELVISID
jgi:hypothetical protein